MIINILISIIIIPLLYYFYNGIFGIESLIIDLIIFYISIITGLKIAHKLYKNKIDLPWIAILIVILLVYIIWTYYPPQIPFFMVK
jgi:hypothetical protein